MFGLGFNSAVKTVLRDEFKYTPSGFQMPILKQVSSEAKRQGLNEYDAAIMFMMVQMNALHPGEEDAKVFIRSHSRHIVSILSLARSPYNDIVNMLAEIQANHGVEVD